MQGPQKGQLLLSFGKPHNEVVKGTISGWIKEDLKQSGINVEHFKAYSASFASSSTAQMSGLPVEQILKGRTGQLNLHGRNFIIRILKRVKPLNKLF